MELENYDKETLIGMWQAITVLEAQDQLRMMGLMDWPNMKKNNRQKIHRDLHRLAYPSSAKEKNYISMQDVQMMLRR